MIRLIRAATLSDALEALSREIANNEAAGESNYIFCEDRLTLLAERAVLKESGGTFLSEVSTFARYLESEKPVLSKEGSVMKINELITKRKGGCFTGASARAVYETIAQLSASRVGEEKLLEAAEKESGMLKQKLYALAEIFKDYNAFLGEDLLDENGYLALLPDAIKGGNLEDVNVFFFAFPSFTKQALEGVRAAFQSAKSVTGIFMGGKEAVYTNQAVRAFLQTADECERFVETRQAPTALCEEGKAILKGVYSPVEGGPMQTERICIFEAQDETEELEQIAALIKKHVSEGKRYSDIAVLVPGADYFLTAEKVFSSYKIPFYLERKRALSEHPFSGYVLSVLEGVSSRLLPEDADRIASSVCFGEADVYRTYLSRYACFRGGATREIKKQEDIGKFKRDKLVPFHEKMLGTIKLFPAEATGEAYVQAVRTLFFETHWEDVLKKLIEDAGGPNEGFTPAEEKFLEIGVSSEDAFGKILLEIEQIAGKRTFTAREFGSLLKSGLDAKEVLLIPPSLDAVFIGDATECMFASTPVLFAAGLTDQLPVVSEDTAIISDKEIKRLKDIKVEIEPAIQEVNARKRESFAHNLACFTERLYMSRPVRLHAVETNKSEVLTFAREAFKTPPMSEVYPYDCSEPMPATLKMIRERERLCRGENWDKEDELRYKELLSALQEKGASIPGGNKHEQTELAAQLWAQRKDTSPTLLEKYFECPYEAFIQRAIRLKEEREGITKADTGNFVHAVLEETAKEFHLITSDRALKDKVYQVSGELMQKPDFSPLQDTDEGRYVRDRLIEESLSAANVAWRQLQGSKFQVDNTEKTLRIEELNIEGKADRIDEVKAATQEQTLVRIIDYKTGYYDDKPIAYYTGQKLQLELYLLAAAKDKTPAGAFYFPASDDFQKEGDTSRYAMRGFYNAEDEVITAFDTALKEGEKSQFFDGARVAPKAGGRGMNKEDFSDFLEYGYYVAQQAEEEMKEGNFAPSPYGNACERCRLKSLCAFTGKERDESNINCGEIITIVRERKQK